LDQPAPAPLRGVGSGWLLALAGVAGACTLVVELAAVRLLAPWFGASAGVWTNVIGVILLALSLGYLAGARLAAGRRPERALAMVLIYGGLFAAWLPALARPVCGLFLPSGLSLHQAAGLWLWGSLAAALVLFLPPAALLGCVGPLAVELLQVRRKIHAGTAGGLVLCASTLGSLAGTFLTTHVLLPHAGLTRSFVSAGAILGLCGAAVWFGASLRGPVRVALGLALLGTLAAAPGSRLQGPALPEGMALLEQSESRYQSLRVVEDTTLGAPMRLLQVNEGLDSFQSVWAEQSGLLGQGFYYDYFALPAWLAEAEGRWKVLILGLGAGTGFRVLEGSLPEGVELEAWGVELDERVVELGQRWFALPAGRDDRAVIAGRDARAVLRRLPSDFDLIVLDAYSNQVEIPAHLSTFQFFAEARRHLAPGGWMAVNAGGFGADDPVVATLGRTLATAFGGALGVRVPRARNWVLYARNEGELPRPDAQGAARGPGWEVRGDVARALIAPLTLPGSVAWLERSGMLLRDDLNPMDLLQRRSLEQGLERLRGSL
jgi:spermidine synthase